MNGRTVRQYAITAKRRPLWVALRFGYVSALSGCLILSCAGCLWRKRATSPTISHPVRLTSWSVSDVEEASGAAGQPQLPVPDQDHHAGLIVDAELSPPNRRVDADYFVALALDRHPRVQAARSRVAAFGHQVPQARSLPDPQLSNTFYPIQGQAIQTASGRIGNQMSLSQTVPWPKKLSAKARVAYQDAQVAMAEIHDIQLEITESIHLAFAEYWLAARVIEITEQNIDLVGDLTRIAAARSKSGGSQQDVLRAELEADKLRDQLITLRKQQQVAAADLAALVNQPTSQMPEPTGNSIGDAQPYLLDDCIARAEATNPGLRGLSAQISRDRAKQQLAATQQYPDLNLGIQWALVSDDRNVTSRVANGRDIVGFSVGATVPIYRRRLSAAVCEAAARRHSTAQSREAARTKLFGQIRRLVAQADAFDQQLGLYRDRIIPRTEQAIRIATNDYTAGRADFAGLVDLEQELLAYQTQVVRTQASLYGVHAQLRRAMGEPAQ